MARARVSVLDQATGQPLPQVGIEVTPRRDSFKHPFRPDSIYNRPIGMNAVYERPTSPVFVPGSLVGINVTTYSKNIWLGQPTDPLTPLYRSNWPVAGQVTLQHTIRCPLNALPNIGTDGHMMVVWNGTVYESGVVRRHLDGWRGEMWWPNDVYGLGWWVNPTTGLVEFHGSGAWGLSAMGGIIRAGEPENGIRHALAGTLSNAAYNGTGVGHTWPAVSHDHNLGTTGNVRIGSLLAIPRWVDLNSLGITDPRAWQFALCLQRYGFYCTGSGNVFSGVVFNGNGAEQQFLRFPPRTSGSDFSDPFWLGMSRATAQVQVVTNNRASVGPTEGAGGGAPLVPFAPDLAA